MNPSSATLHLAPGAMHPPSTFESQAQHGFAPSTFDFSDLETYPSAAEDTSGLATSANASKPGKRLTG
jgi:hypothetical protein